VGAEDDLVELDLDAQEGVLAALAARPGAALSPKPPNPDAPPMPPLPPMSYCWRCCGSLSTS
jgi:hypothetical protein